MRLEGQFWCSIIALVMFPTVTTTLQEEAKLQKKKIAALNARMKETSDALLGLLEEVRK